MSRNEEQIDGKVLFVDDEENILSSLKRGFLFSPIRVSTANNGKMALELLSQEHYDVVISDYRMPGMDGMEFLKAVKEKYPSIARIIFSGYIDRKILIRSLTNGWASTFFTKPWDNNALERKISRILKIKRKINEAGFTVINNAYELPTCSVEYNAVFSLMDKDQFHDDLLKIVETDPVLAFKVLQIANSIFFGEREINSVREALELLHPSILKDMFISTRHVKDLNWPETEVKKLQDIYINSILVQKYVLPFYSCKFGQQDIKNVSSVGIIHNIGQILLLTYFPDRFDKILSLSSAYPEKSFSACEEELGFKEESQALIGSLFLDLFNLPESITNVIMTAHSPGAYDCTEQKWACVLSFLENLVILLRRQKSETDPCLESLNLPVECSTWVDEILPQLREDLNAIEKIYA